MDILKFSIVVATCNRAHLVGRAIRSCLDQEYPAAEIIVVDDASTDNTRETVEAWCPRIRYLRQPENQGCSVARNRGIREARGEWVVVLDDDDSLQPGALRVIADRLSALAGEYPVAKFACSNGQIPEPFRVLSLDDYVTGLIQGDFTPVIHRERFLGAGLAYPDLWVGAEHLLWWRVARSWGIPAWNAQVTRVGVDAPTRLTSWGEHRIRRAREYALMQEMTLEAFSELEVSFPEHARRKHQAAAVYWLLAGERRRALPHLRHLGQHLMAFLLPCVLLALPTPTVRWLFRLWGSKRSARRLPKSIALLVTGLGLGGAEVQVASLAKTLKGRGWRVRVVSIVPAEALVEDLTDVGIEVTILGVRSRLAVFTAVVQLARLLRRERPSVLHAHMFHANLLARLVRPVAPVPVLICTAHNTYEASSRAKNLHEITWRERAYRLTDFLCDLTTQISQVGLDRYARVRAAPRHKMRIVPNGVDTSVFRPDPEARRATRAEFGVDDRFLWLAVGRIERAKDYPNLLQAFARVLPEHGRTELLITGDGSRGKEVRALAGELRLGDRVRFLGVRRDVPRIMNGADGYVMSSSWEGLPMVLMEAHACGLPIVTTAVGGCGEIVKNGETGLLVPPGDPDALARAMVQLMDLSDGERRRMAEGARRWARDQFSLERIVDRWEAVYAEFLDLRGGKPRRTTLRAATR